MRRLLLLALIANVVVVATQDAANASCSTVTQTTFAFGKAVVTTREVCTTEAVSSSSSQGPTAVPTRDSDLDAVCVAQSLGLQIDPFAYCAVAPIGEQPQKQITAALVAAAFARMPLPPQQLVVQPPGGRTLVNFDTNFYTVAEPFETSLTLLNQRVDLRVRATGFRWQFGDGGSSDTTEPGAAYPSLDVTHRYLRKATVAAGVDTTYAADYRVAGGPWTPVPGTATIVGPTQQLEVLTARPQLVGAP